MRLFRILLHGLLLFLANSAATYAGFIVFRLMKPANQIAIQVPIAAVLSVLLFVMWSLLVRVLPFRRLILRTPFEFAWVFLAALLWNPLVFVPLHYLTQGYFTSPGNIMASMIFQFPVNLAALALAWAITRPRARADAGEGAAQP